jgi:hypothetical protein
MRGIEQKIGERLLPARIGGERLGQGRRWTVTGRGKTEGRTLTVPEVKRGEGSPGAEIVLKEEASEHGAVKLLGVVEESLKRGGKIGSAVGKASAFLSKGVAHILHEVERSLLQDLGDQ